MGSVGCLKFLLLGSTIVEAVAFITFLAGWGSSNTSDRLASNSQGAYTIFTISALFLAIAQMCFLSDRTRRQRILVYATTLLFATLTLTAGALLQSAGEIAFSAADSCDGLGTAACNGQKTVFAGVFMYGTASIISFVVLQVLTDVDVAEV